MVPALPLGTAGEATCPTGCRHAGVRLVLAGNHNHDEHQHAGTQTRKSHADVDAERHWRSMRKDVNHTASVIVPYQGTGISTSPRRYGSCQMHPPRRKEHVSTEI